MGVQTTNHQPNTSAVLHHSRHIRRLANLSLSVLFATTGILPFASEAATFRHKVNDALQSADPDVSSLIPSPDGSKVYFISDLIPDADYEWYSVPSTGGAATLIASDGPGSETKITSDGPIW